MGPYRISAQDESAFEHDGYFFVRGLFDREETQFLAQAMESDPNIRSHFFDWHDKGGAATRIAVWNHPGDSIYGLAARSERMVSTLETLLGGEVYHYHSKLTAKEPHEGGAWEWHQDYGYWYLNGCLYPLMASCMIALDHSTRANGCLQVLRGSHLMGRLDHKAIEGRQAGADPERVEQAMRRLELVYCELAPGDGVFFHCNTLHRSDQNRSADRRWTLICSYNAARNDPYIPHHHPGYTPLHRVPDGALKQAGPRGASGSAESFIEGPEQPRGLDDAAVTGTTP